MDPISLAYARMMRPVTRSSPYIEGSRRLKNFGGASSYNPMAEAIYGHATSAPITPNIGGEIARSILATIVGSKLGEAKKAYFEAEKEKERQNRITDEKSMLDYRATLDEKERRKAFDRTIAGSILGQNLITDPTEAKSIYDLAVGGGELPAGIFGKLSAARKAEEERKRQIETSDEAVKRAADMQGELSLLGAEKNYDYLDPSKYIMSPEMRGKLTGTISDLYNPDASVDPNLVNEQASRIVAGGGITPYQKPEYKEITRSIQDKSGNWWKATYTSTDGGLTLSNKPVSVEPLYKPDSPDGSKSADKKIDDFRSEITHLDTLYGKKATLQSLRDDFGGIIDEETAKVSLSTVQKQIDDAERYIKSTYPEQWKTRTNIQEGRGSAPSYSGAPPLFPWAEGTNSISSMATRPKPSANAPSGQSLSQEQAVKELERRKLLPPPPAPTPKYVPPKMRTGEGSAIDQAKRGIERIEKNITGNIMSDEEIAKANRSVVEKRIKHLESVLAPPYQSGNVELGKLKKRLEKLMGTKTSPRDYPSGTPSLFPWEK